MDSELTLATHLEPDGEVMFQQIEGEAVLLDLKTGVYMGLDTVGARFWELLSERGTIGGVAEAMLAEYDVQQSRLERDLLTLGARLLSDGLVNRVAAS